jgi:hypothetical protein
MEKYERLKIARLRSGFRSASDASVYLSIPYGTYSGHENGSRGIKDRELLHYARAFKVSAYWLAFGQSVPKQKLKMVGRAGSLAVNSFEPETLNRVIEIEPPFPIAPETRVIMVASDEFEPMFQRNDLVLIGIDQTARELISSRVAVKIEGDILLAKLLTVDISGNCHIQLPTGKVYLNISPSWVAPILGAMFKIPETDE